MASPFLLSLVLVLLHLHLHLPSTTPSPPPPPAAAAAAAAEEESPKYPCLPPHDRYPFCNTTLPLPTRARSLLSLLSPSEKPLLLSSTSPSIDRLGLPPYQWWSESLHGLSANGPGVRFLPPLFPSSTSFPQVLLQSSSFNSTLWSLLSLSSSLEALAFRSSSLAGLTFWAPNVNLFRDPRWGRGQETPGEDPLLSSSFASSFVSAFQNHEDPSLLTSLQLRDDPRHPSRIKLSACCKHYVAYDLEKWGNYTRDTFDAKVTKQDMEDAYEPAFRSCVREGKASCVMCSYNALNGVPVCASAELMRKVREEWGLQGYITSDCNAVATIYEYQKYASSAVDAVAYALKAGVDLNCGGYYSLYAQQAIDAGNLTEADIDRALFNLISVQLRLGLFDGDPSINSPYGKLGPEDVCTIEHRRLALEAVRQGIVLLKNDDRLLPLAPTSISSIAVIGPAGNNASKFFGDYSGTPCEERSLLDALQDRISHILFAIGCVDDIPCSLTNRFEEAASVAEAADIVLVVAGLDLTQETEQLDRVSLLLPGKQEELVTMVAKVSKRPVVLILVGGGPMDVSFAKENPRVGSILWVGYPGEAGAEAIADVIFGSFNPGGRLTMTWYPESFTKVPMSDMNMRAEESRGYPGRTYRFYTGPTVYEFGHGLSYSNYSLSFLSAPEKISLSEMEPPSPFLLENPKDDYVLVDMIAGSRCEAMKFGVRVLVKNEGGMDGSHAMLLFSRFEAKLKGAPRKQLIAFDRVWVMAGQAEEVSVLVDPCAHMSMANVEGKRVLAFGRHFLMLGNGVEHSLMIVL